MTGLRQWGAGLALCMALPGGAVHAQSYAARLATAVQACWVIDADSEAADTVVTVGFSLARDGRVVPGSLVLLEASSAGEAAVRLAYQAARRAILRCQGAAGYDLPVESYARWREVELTFDPTEVRL